MILFFTISITLLELGPGIRGVLEPPVRKKLGLAQGMSGIKVRSG